jgi:hypothetical protein
MCFGGSDIFTGYHVISGRNPLKMGTTEFATFEINGVESSTSGMFDHMAIRCLGDVMGSGSDTRHWCGACTLVGKDGDQFSTTYNGAGDADVHFVVNSCR